MRKILLFILITTFSNIFSQTADLQFVEILNNGINYDVKIQIKGTPAFNLGSSNIKFNFNNADLGSPILLTAHNFSGGSYQTVTVTTPKPSIVSINIELNAINTGTQVNTSWTDVVTVRFTTLNVNGSSNLSFRDMKPLQTDNPTVLFKDDETNQVTQGTFSPSNTTPLPVELSTFKVNAVEGAKAQLEWETASETNNYGFEIERTIVSNNTESYKWEKIGFVEGHGNSNSPKLYSFTDKNPTGGSKFAYRLKQIDIDGAFDYSDAVEVEVLPAKFELLPNYPNPFNPTTLIKFSLPEDTKLAINIYNILGEKVITLVNEEFKAGYHQVQFNSNSNGLNLSSGLYIYSIESKNFTQVKKMILLK